MRQVVYRTFGVPEEVLEVEEAPTPRPGPGEVTIRLEAAPVHLADLKQVRGLPWFDQFKPPHVPGFEGVGRIAQVGADVTEVVAGDRVFLPIGFGTWKEELVAPAKGLWPAPEGIAAEQLALIAVNLPTAYLMLDTIVSLQPGDWIIQNAANSNVGYYLIDLAKARGVNTVNVVRRPELIGRLDAQGGSLNLVDGDDLAERVTAAVPPGRLKLAIDAIAGDATTRLGACFGGHGGTIASYGMLSGEPCKVPPEMLMLDNVTLTGFYMSRTLGEMSDTAVQRMQGEINDHLVAHPPHAPIAAIYDFGRVRDAVIHAGRTAGDRDGKIILQP